MNTPQWAVGMQRLMDGLYKDARGEYHICLHAYASTEEEAIAVLGAWVKMIPFGSSINMHPPQPPEIWHYYGHRPVDAQAALMN